MHIASIGIDLGKTTFHLVALGERNRPRSRRSPTRLNALVMTTPAAGNSGRSPASARWSPPPPWLPSAMALPFVADATSQVVNVGSQVS
jgi:hypothetical protein